MDAISNRPPTSSSSSTSASPVYSAAPVDKLVRHKLFLLTCDKLSDLARTVGRHVLRHKLGMLSICRTSKSNDSYAIDECSNLLSPRDTNTVAGPLFARRSSRPPAPVVPSTSPSILSLSPIIAVSPVFEISMRPHEYRESPIIVPDIIPSSPPRSAWSFNFSTIIEYAAPDSITMPLASESDAESDSEIEDGLDALDVFLMDEDSPSFVVRKRKSHRTAAVAEKRHCDEAQGSPMALSAPIPVPQPSKKVDHVLDTLVPLRGFFFESR